LNDHRIADRRQVEQSKQPLAHFGQLQHARALSVAEWVIGQETRRLVEYSIDPKCRVAVAFETFDRGASADMAAILPWTVPSGQASMNSLITLD
jgi:hypothetical protein